MKGTFCGRRLPVLCGIAVAATLAPATAFAAPPVTGVLPAAPAAPAVPVSTPAAPAAPVSAPAAAAAAPVVKAVASAPAATAGLKTTVLKTVGKVTPTLKQRTNWKMKKVIVRVHFGPKNGSSGGTVQTCRADDGWLICKNLPLAGELINTCNKNEVVTISGTFTEMSRVKVDPIRMTVSTDHKIIWTGVRGVGSFGNQYVANDTTTEFSRMKTFAFGTATRTGRQEAQSLVSNNRGVADQFIYMRAFTTIVVDFTTGDVYVDVDIRGPGITCVNNSRDCDDDYDDDWGKHDR
jgi:hypothetical protein